MFKSLFNTKKNTETDKKDDKIMSITALLVEAAMIDGNFEDIELDIIISIVKNTFSLKNEEEIRKLVETARKDLESHGDLVTYTRTVKENWNLEERISVIEMMWKVCLIDGKVEPYEDTLIRRVAGLIYVSDKDRNLAKQKVLNS